MSKLINFTGNAHSTALLYKSLRSYVTYLCSNTQKCSLKYNYIPDRLPWYIRYIMIINRSTDYFPPRGLVCHRIKATGVVKHVYSRVYAYTQR